MLFFVDSSAEKSYGEGKCLKSNRTEAWKKVLRSASFGFALNTFPSDWRGQQGHHPEGLPAPRDGVQVAVRQESLRQREQRRAGRVQEDHRQEAEGGDESCDGGSRGHH